MATICLLIRTSPLQAWQEAVSKGFVGAAIVVKGDKAVLLEVNSPAGDNRVSFDLNSKVPICSVTKLMVAQVVTQLVAQKKLSFNGSIGGYLPWLPEPFRPITIQQLLCHTSGLPNMDRALPAKGGWPDPRVPLGYAQ